MGFFNSSSGGGFRGLIDQVQQKSNPNNLPAVDTSRVAEVPVNWRTMKKGGKVRGVGCAQRGHGKACKR